MTRKKTTVVSFDELIIFFPVDSYFLLFDIPPTIPEEAEVVPAPLVIQVPGLANVGDMVSPSSETSGITSNNSSPNVSPNNISNNDAPNNVPMSLSVSTEDRARYRAWDPNQASSSPHWPFGWLFGHSKKQK